MELRHLRYFVTVARLRHFTRAAEELNIAQPSLSHQISQLETELKVKLFDRSSRRVELTDAGVAFLRSAERILADVASAHGEIQEFIGEVRGRVVLGTLQSVAQLKLPRVLAQFFRRYPRIEVALRNDMTEAHLKAIHQGTIDVALVHISDQQPRHDISTEPLFVEELAIAASPDHRLAKRRSVRLEELRDEVFVLSKHGSGLVELLEQSTRKQGWTPRCVYESGDFVTIRALISERMGIALFPRYVADMAGAPIVTIPLAKPKMSRTVSLAWSATRKPNPAANLLMRFLREHLATPNVT
ncbi:MAG: LysR family transcriptional regulator [Vulcanimicrobiaceae bacterium]